MRKKRKEKTERKYIKERKKEKKLFDGLFFVNFVHCANQITKV